MVLRRLSVEAFGGIERYETDVYADVVTVFGRAGDMLAAAVRALCGVPLSPRERAWLRDETVLQADLNGKRCYRVRMCGKALTLQVTDRQSGEDCTEAYRRATARSSEDIRSLCFDRRSRRLYPCLLGRYLYAPSAEDTDGIGGTAVFHRAARWFVRDFRREPLRSDKPLWLTLGEDGRFSVTREQSPWEEVTLSETEAVLFSFLCFLHIHRFWRKMYDTVDMHRESMPLIVQDFAEYVDASVPLLPYLHRLRRETNQMLLVVPCAADASRLEGWPSVQTLLITEK